MFYLFAGLSCIIAYAFNINKDNLIQFYSSVLPFVFALIVGIKAIIFKINKYDYDDEKKIKENLNEIALDVFFRLKTFFILSLIIFIMMTFSIHKDRFLILTETDIWNKYKENIVNFSNFVQDFVIILSFFYFLLIIIDINTEIKEIIKLNNLKNKKNIQNGRGADD